MSIEDHLTTTALKQTGGVWTLYQDGRKYVTLLDATSRHDAEVQVAEMLLTAAIGRRGEGAERGGEPQ